MVIRKSRARERHHYPRCAAYSLDQSPPRTYSTREEIYARPRESTSYQEQLYREVHSIEDQQRESRMQEQLQREKQMQEQLQRESRKQEQLQREKRMQEQQQQRENRLYEQQQQRENRIKEQLQRESRIQEQLHREERIQQQLQEGPSWRSNSAALPVRRGWDRGRRLSRPSSTPPNFSQARSQHGPRPR